MVRNLVLFALPGVLLLMGCATPQKPSSAAPAGSAGLSGVTAYYAQATAPHHRAVRKPVRDQQTLALRRLAGQVDALLAATEPAGGDVQLAAHAEPVNSADSAAIETYRTALVELRNAAHQADLAAVRASYARLLVAARRLSTAPVLAE
jgi:hypothetical protein